MGKKTSTTEVKVQAEKIVSIEAEERAPERDPMLKLSDEIHDWYAQNAMEQEQIRRDQYEEWRKREQCRIFCERYNSPLAPYTQVMQDEAARVGTTIYMCPAVAMKESSCGHVTYMSGTDICPGESHNAWGLIGYPRGFSSWEEGVRAFYQFLWDWNISRGYAADGGYTTPNYCEPWPGSWAPEVDAHIREIQAIQVAPYDPNPN